MASIATTRLSSKGQVVIPEEVRKALKLRAGERFVVLADGDSVLLERIEEPTVAEFQEFVAKVRGQAKRAGVKSSDVRRIVKKARRREE